MKGEISMFSKSKAVVCVALSAAMLLGLTEIGGQEPVQRRQQPGLLSLRPAPPLLHWSPLYHRSQHRLWIQARSS